MKIARGRRVRRDESLRGAARRAWRGCLRILGPLKHEVSLFEILTEPTIDSDSSIYAFYDQWLRDTEGAPFVPFFITRDAA